MSVRHRLVVLLCVLLSGSAGAVSAQDSVAYRNQALGVDARVRDLLGRMTLEEKFWQLYMIPGDLDDSTHDYSHGIFGLQVDPKRAARAPNAPAAAPLEQAADDGGARRSDTPSADDRAASAA